MASALSCLTPTMTVPDVPRPVVPPDARLLFIGDAGGPAPNPVLGALQASLTGPVATMVVFLGDNIYPDGMPVEGAAGRRDAEERMRAQLASVLATTAMGIVVPGNHDWGSAAENGRHVLAREAAFVARHGGDRVRMRPAPGCPGPDVVDVGTTVRLIVLDTEWWLRHAGGDRDALSSCLTSPDDVLDSLGRAISASPDRRVIVVGHHPLVSAGRHGGRFGWRQHLFPLVEVQPWLWVPLPIIGSLYPFVNRLRTTEQDLRAPRYTRMRLAMDSVLAVHGATAWIAGHEHNLQVGRTPRGVLHVVSGSGSRSRAAFVAPTPGTILAVQANGYVQLDTWAGGRVRLAVLTVDQLGRTTQRLLLEIP